MKGNATNHLQKLVALVQMRHYNPLPLWDCAIYAYKFTVLAQLIDLVKG